MSASTTSPMPGSTIFLAMASPMTMKANSPPGPSSAEVSMVAGQGTRNRRSSTDEHARLDGDETEQPEQDRQRVVPQVGDVEAHADGEEEHAEQQPLEGFDRRLDGAVILGLGEQQAGDEGAEAPSTGRRRR